MITQKIAVPSKEPGGLTCERSDHFGHSPFFTIATLTGKDVTKVTCVANVPHGSKECVEPINILKEQGVTAIVAEAIGQRPLMGLQEAGIKVFYSSIISSPTVQDVIEAVKNNELQPIEIEQACNGGHGNCHSH